MAELTRCQAYVLSATRRLHWMGGGPVTFSAVRAGAIGFGYDEVHRAVTALVSKGLLSKPRRGYYLPNEEDA